MDESDYVCPLCCEELDISDREFYPCKCGYQVCMWCWHRIRESESGLCPACRTPYGEDPHQFSAVDVEEVMRANKEKEAAAKRERQRQLHEEEGLAAMEVPKDRMQLANMRVIRRNLVYAVGLPSHIATEEILRKPEYFGQYGKIAKIVINRTQAIGDPRRASASAYVTFAHKEDTLACILALDGFNLENRNIRASYGTSKYCSAFIKNVRCNNPECTYLHEMGAAEDTFTKQEIQAGYVTSGRDVMARQQQILAEQMRQGSTVPLPRKRIGGGGPSVTGKAALNPIFPAPEYDEPTKPSPPSVPLPSGIARAQTSVINLNPANISAKLGRSSSICSVPTNGSKSPPLGPASAAAPNFNTKRAASTGNGTISSVAGANIPTVTTAAATTSNAPSVAAATTAASVVAGGRFKSEMPDSHTTLTPLTPLRRSSKTAGRSSSFVGLSSVTDPSTVASEKSVAFRNGNSKKSSMSLPLQQLQISDQLNDSRHETLGGNPGFASMQSSLEGPSHIGGNVIAPPLPPHSLSTSSPAGFLGVNPDMPVDQLGGHSIGMNGGSSLSSTLGGEVFTGQLPRSNKAVIGSHGDKWNGAVPIGGTSLGTTPMLGAESGEFSSTSRGTNSLWGSGIGGNLTSGPSPFGGSVIGSSRAPGSDRVGASGNPSSTLASILGINLPTGSGSLHQTSTSLWASGPSIAPTGPSPLSSLNCTAIPTQDMFNGRHSNGGSSLIGGVPITSTSMRMSGPGAIGSNNKSDIALLQSLLPGVHITSGSESLRFGGNNQGWNITSSGLGPSGLNGDAIGSWTSSMPPSASSAVGAIGQNSFTQNQRRGPGIW